IVRPPELSQRLDTPPRPSPRGKWPPPCPPRKRGRETAPHPRLARMEGTLRSRLRKTAKAASVGAFLAHDRVGLHVLPKHYYSSVPDMAWLRKHRNAWQKPASLVGVRWNLDEQLDWLRKICRGYYAEVQGLSLYRQALASGVGLGYGPIESQVLHCFIRSAGPRTIIEIGGGVTTALMAEASKMNARDGGRSARLVSIEPFPNPVLRALPELAHID